LRVALMIGSIPIMEKKKPGRPRDPNSKRSLGIDRNTKTRKVFYDEDEIFDLIDLLCSEGEQSEELPSPDNASVAVRAALREYLEKRGYWPMTGELKHRISRMKKDRGKS
jgi:hypothetical protein